MKVEVFIILKPDGQRVLVNTNQITTIVEDGAVAYVVTSAGEKIETTDSFDTLMSKYVQIVSS